MSKKTYILVDSLNMFMRAKHVGGGRDIDMRVGMAMHIMFNSIKKVWREFDGDHVVMCLEGRSWRKDFILIRQTEKLQWIEHLNKWKTMSYFLKHMMTWLHSQCKTNCSVIQQKNAEADDLIATWIQQHPEDDHVIVSTDSDFYQLLAPNVIQYNGTTDQIVSLEGFKNAKTGETVIDKKTGEPKPPINPDYVLFEKCVRGDSSDNIFSAYPGARTKGTRNKTGILEAYNDRKTGGFNYNNFMLQRWVDHEEVEHRVKDDYERNRILIDLTAQPDEIKAESRQIVREAINKEPATQVGIHFMKFCAKWNLQRMSEDATAYAEFLNGQVR